MNRIFQTPASQFPNDSVMSVSLPGTFERCMSGHYYACVRGDEECPVCQQLQELRADKERLDWYIQIQWVIEMDYRGWYLRDPAVIEEGVFGGFHESPRAAIDAGMAITEEMDRKDFEAIDAARSGLASGKILRCLIAELQSQVDASQQTIRELRAELLDAKEKLIFVDADLITAIIESTENSEYWFDRVRAIQKDIDTWLDGHPLHARSAPEPGEASSKGGSE